MDFLIKSGRFKPLHWVYANDTGLSVRCLKRRRSMLQPVKIIKISMVIALGIILQIILIIADNGNSPDKVALAFTKAYFSLDKKGMAENICSELTKETDVIDQYIQRVEKESKDTGFKLYAKSLIYHTKTHFISVNDTQARVEISGERRYSINPVYTFVAMMFMMGDTYHFDETIDLVNENGQWKVCGNPFSLNG